MRAHDTLHGAGRNRRTGHPEVTRGCLAFDDDDATALVDRARPGRAVPAEATEQDGGGPCPEMRCGGSEQWVDRRTTEIDFGCAIELNATEAIQRKMLIGRRDVHDTGLDLDAASGRLYLHECALVQDFGETTLEAWRQMLNYEYCGRKARGQRAEYFGQRSEPTTRTPDDYKVGQFGRATCGSRPMSRHFVEDWSMPRGAAT